MQEPDPFECSVVEQVASHAPISFDELQHLFKGHSWNRLFAATDRLSRRGILAIKRVDRRTYLISLGPLVPISTDAARASSSVRFRS